MSFDTVHSLLSHLSILPFLRVLLLDLLSLLFYASNQPTFSQSIHNSHHCINSNEHIIVISIPLIRLLAITSTLRFIESRAIQYTQSSSSSSSPTTVNYGVYDDEEIDRECDYLKEKGVLTINNRDEVADEIREFQNLGGKVVFHSSYHSRSFPIAIRPDDCVWSICHEGCNRSQILCEGLTGVRRALASHPHVTPANQVGGKVE